jgi:hypothetical protein
MRTPSRPAFDAAAAGALVLALPGLTLDPAMFFASWLAAWWFCAGVVLGLLANTLMGTLTGGRWAGALRLVALPAGRSLPWLLVAFLPLAAGLAHLYPWAADPDGAWTRGIERPGFQLAWYRPGFFWARMAAIALCWWLAARPAARARDGRAAAALVAITLTGTLVAIDLVMSLTPGWYSTGFGLVTMAGGALGGAALASIVLARWAPARFPAPRVRVALPTDPPVWRDFGNLQLMWTMMWAYLAFVEFLIIWAEDLPREIAWFVPRLQGGWSVVGLGLALGAFALPQVALLWRTNKDAPHRLARLAAWQLLGQLVNSAWLVLPAVAPHSLLGWWLVPLLALAIGLPPFGRLVHAIAQPARAEIVAEAPHA